MVIGGVQGVYIAGMDGRWVIVVKLSEKIRGMNVLPGFP
jgi:hypothetical protein